MMVYYPFICKFKTVVGKPFSDHFKRITKRYKIAGYNLYIMRQSAYLVVNPIPVYTCVQARLYTELRIQKLCDSFYPAFETLSVRLSLKSGNQSHFPMSND